MTKPTDLYEKLTQQVSAIGSDLQSMKLTMVQESSIAKDIAETAAKVATELAQKTADSVLLFGKDIEYIKNDVREIKITMKEMSSSAITRQEHQEVVDVQKDHETRTRNLEESKWKAIGSASVVTGILTLIGSYIINKI